MRLRSTVFVCAALAACEPRPTVPVATQRDSAGIRIVEHSAGVTGLPTWTVAEPPEAVIGETADVDVAHQFTQIRGAVRLSDGRIVVGDTESREARYFEPSGRYLLTVGGQGEGPGELRNLYSVDRLPGDTLVIGGWPIGSRYWFDERGDFIRNQALGPWFPGRAGRTMLDGSLVIDSYQQGGLGNTVEYFAAYGTESTIRPHGFLERISRNGETRDTVAPFAAEEQYKMGELRSTFAMHALPFTPIGLIAWSRGEIHVGDTERAEVITYGFDGVPRRILRWTPEPVRVTAEDRRRFHDEVINGARNPVQARNLERWFLEISYPETKPAFDGLIAHDDGTLWIKDSPVAGAERDYWTVYAPDGRAAARVVLPPDLDVLDVDGTHVLARWTDELDVQYVRSYRIVR